MAAEVIYVTIDTPTVESIPTTVGGSPTNVVDVDVIGDYNDVIALINNAVPTGTIIQGGWTTEPPNYKFLDGQTLTGGVAAYPALAAYYPSWVSGADIVLPNLSGYTLLGTTGTAGTRPITSNSKTVTITSNHLPTHTHSVGTLVNAAESAHTHSVGTLATAADSPGHVHYVGGGSVGGWAPAITMGTESVGHNHASSSGANFVSDSLAGAPDFNVQSAAFYGFSAVGTALQSANHNHSLSGYTTGAHQTHTHTVSGSTGAPASHNHTISGSTGNNTTTATALPYDTTPAHMLIKYAVKL
jgi:hypothetical protein